jgi:histidinol-phosphate/aromatic aminotransferase/cobyric acid decarboxylase-like protein
LSAEVRLKRLKRLKRRMEENKVFVRRRDHEMPNREQAVRVTVNRLLYTHPTESRQ